MTDEARDETAGEATAGPAGPAAEGSDRSNKGTTSNGATSNGTTSNGTTSEGAPSNGATSKGATSTEAAASATPDEAAKSAARSATKAADSAEESAEERERPKVVIKDNRRVDRNGGAAAKPVTEEIAAPAEPGSEENGQLDELRAGLEELTRDLQRVTAEYANYRKRVDRDRTLVAEQAVGSVLTQLLPVLDDLDRARNHGDLVGPFAAVAEQLSTSLGKFGLTAFGDVGDPFDPTLHEAVAHTSSPDVTETSCIEIMRRGYLLGERLLRPALVAVADPE